jgi:hypothetical protein
MYHDVQPEKVEDPGLSSNRKRAVEQIDESGMSWNISSVTITLH